MDKVLLKKFVKLWLKNWFNLWEKIKYIEIKDQLDYSKLKYINLLWYYFSYFGSESWAYSEYPLIEMILSDKFMNSIAKSLYESNKDTNNNLLEIKNFFSEKTSYSSKRDEQICINKVKEKLIIHFSLSLSNNSLNDFINEILKITNKKRKEL